MAGCAVGGVIGLRGTYFVGSCSMGMGVIIMWYYVALQCYSRFQVGCPKIATRIQACAKFPFQNSRQSARIYAHAGAPIGELKEEI